MSSSANSVLTALRFEEPLPLLVVEMSLWSLGVGAAVMFSLGVLSVIASPVIMAANLSPTLAGAVQHQLE